jgi:hypothetical protein
MLDLTPVERAVLRQVRDLFGEASVTSYRLGSLVSRWPEAHRAANQIAFDGLVKKGLLVQRPGEQMFGITTAGLKAMV